MSLVFRESENLDAAAIDLLVSAYEEACVELAADHYLSSSELAGLIDEMATAIRNFYRTGQHGKDRLTHHAVSCALRSMEQRNTH